MNKIFSDKMMLIISSINAVLGIINLVAFQLGYMPLHMYIYVIVAHAFIVAMSLLELFQKNPLFFIINALAVLLGALYYAWMI